MTVVEEINKLSDEERVSVTTEVVNSYIPDVQAELARRGSPIVSLGIKHVFEAGTSLVVGVEMKLNKGGVKYGVLKLVPPGKQPQLDSNQTSLATEIYIYRNKDDLLGAAGKLLPQRYATVSPRRGENKVGFILMEYLPSTELEVDHDLLVLANMHDLLIRNNAFAPDGTLKNKVTYIDESGAEPELASKFIDAVSICKTGHETLGLPLVHAASTLLGYMNISEAQMRSPAFGPRMSKLVVLVEYLRAKYGFNPYDYGHHADLPRQLIHVYQNFLLGKQEDEMVKADVLDDLSQNLQAAQVDGPAALAVTKVVTKLLNTTDAVTCEELINSLINT